MAERFSLDADGARAAGTRMSAAGEQLQAAHQRLLGVLTEYDGCWGDDDIGQSFSQGYVPNADATRDNTKVLADNEIDVGNYVNSAVDAFEQTDSENAEMIDQSVADEVAGWTKS